MKEVSSEAFTLGMPAKRDSPVAIYQCANPRDSRLQSIWIHSYPAKEKVTQSWSVISRGTAAFGSHCMLSDFRILTPTLTARTAEFAEQPRWSPILSAFSYKFWVPTANIGQA